MNFNPEDLDYVDSLQNRSLGLPAQASSLTPTVSQSAFQKMADSSFAPWENAQSNFNKTFNDFTNPQGGILKAGLTDAADIKKLKHDPFGGGSTGRQIPTLSDEHLGPANEHGVRPVLPSGYDYLNNFGIEDNSALLSKQPSAQLGGIISPATAMQPSMLGDAAKGAATSAAADSGILGDLMALL